MYPPYEMNYTQHSCTKYTVLGRASIPVPIQVLTKFIITYT